MKTQRVVLSLVMLTCAGAGAGCSAWDADSESVRSATRPLEDGAYVLLSLADDSCVEVTGAAADNGADIGTEKCRGAPEQQWRFTVRPDDSFRIKSVSSNKCMRAYQETNVQQGACRYRRSKWLVTEDSPGVLQLSSHKTGLCATAADGSVTQQTCSTDRDPTQLFEAQPADGNPDPCAAQDVQAVGLCDMVLGTYWDGQQCVTLSGCSCEGTDCPYSFPSPGECELAYQACRQ